MEHRFGFNGKENDKDADAYDFGARMYNSKLGRWWSVDAMAGKYPQLSPYNFSGNNPVLFVDYDGNDFGLKINHDPKNKTIVVVANIYTVSNNSRNVEHAQAAAAAWNSKSYNVEGYAVSFEVNVINIQEKVGSFEDFYEKNKGKWTTVSKRGKTSVDLKKARDFYNNRIVNVLNNSDVLDPVGNSYTGTIGGEARTGPGRRMGTINGTRVFSDWDDKLDEPFARGRLTFAHELGHLFGLDDFEIEDLNGNLHKGEYYSSEGVMSYNTFPLQSIHLEDITNLLKYAVDALNKGGAKIDGKDTGRLPARFPGDVKPQVTILEEKGNGSFKDLKIK